MLDFVKISFLSKDYAEYLRGNRYLSLVNESISRFSSKKTYIYNSLKFEIYTSGRVAISGSLHKYWNKGQHNYNDYCFTDILTTIEDLILKFTPFMLLGKINNIEMGINNVISSFETTEYLKRIIAMLITEKHPITKNDLKGFKKGYYFQKTQYGFKIYDKGAQFGMFESMVRHELKIFKMQTIKDMGIVSLIDLCDLEKLKLLSKKLLECYNDVLIAEYLNTENLSRKEERIYNECINSDNWNNWNRDKRCRKKAEFERIIHEHGLTDIKSIIIDLMRFKIPLLLTETEKSRNVFTKIQNQYSVLIKNKKDNVFTININGKTVDTLVCKLPRSSAI